MQIKNILIGAAAASAVSARPQHQNVARQNNSTLSPSNAPTPVFHVSNFTAGCIPHSALCAYNFDVYQPGSMESYFGYSVHCNATLQSNGALPPVTEGSCYQSSRTWSVLTASDAFGGLIFKVSQPVTPSSNQTGGIAIPAYFLNMTQTGASVQQVYTGPTEFDLY